MISVRRAADRFRSAHDGITSWHAFSSGAHYDPDNVAFGVLVACDEHLVAPGAGFEQHAHAGVELLSWVVSGALAHSDGAGRATVVRPGSVQYQLAGRGIEHVERNASEREPLRFVQLWLLADADETAYAVQSPPVELRAGRFDVVVGDAHLDGREYLFAHVAAGRFDVGGHALAAGDSVRVRHQAVQVTGAGQLLVVRVEE